MGRAHSILNLSVKNSLTLIKETDATNHNFKHMQSGPLVRQRTKTDGTLAKQRTKTDNSLAARPINMSGPNLVGMMKAKIQQSVNMQKDLNRMNSAEHVETIHQLYNQKRANQPIDRFNPELKRIWSDLVEYNPAH